MEEDVQGKSCFGIPDPNGSVECGRDHCPAIGAIREAADLALVPFETGPILPGLRVPYLDDSPDSGGDPSSIGAERDRVDPDLEVGDRTQPAARGHVPDDDLLPGRAEFAAPRDDPAVAAERDAPRDPLVSPKRTEDASRRHVPDVDFAQLIGLAPVAGGRCDPRPIGAEGNAMDRLRVAAPGIEQPARGNLPEPQR